MLVFAHQHIAAAPFLLVCRAARSAKLVPPSPNLFHLTSVAAKGNSMWFSTFSTTFSPLCGTLTHFPPPCSTIIRHHCVKINYKFLRARGEKARQNLCSSRLSTNSKGTKIPPTISCEGNSITLFLFGRIIQIYFFKFVCFAERF